MSAADEPGDFLVQINRIAKVVRRKLAAPLGRLRDAQRLRQFLAVPTGSLDASALGAMAPGALAELLRPERTPEWQEDRKVIDSLGLPELTGGVNPGDQRALHALVLGLRPSHVLEVGTHLGCSTVSLALAGRRVGSRIVTCDIAHVNDPINRPWLRYGSRYSPRELLVRAGCEGLVAFQVSDSRSFLRGAGAIFDLIFLDGDHAAAAVYQELPLAVQALRPGGFVLLHDYYPGNQSLWGNDPPLPGPFLAVERLRSEGAGLQVLPLGTLGWTTRSGSNVTSLALVSGAT